MTPQQWAVGVAVMFIAIVVGVVIALVLVRHG